MNSHRAQVPLVAANYFRSIGVTEHPVIAETHTPTGWKLYPWRKRVSLSEMRRLRAAGVQWVALDAGGHRADFTTRELSPKTGLRGY